MVIESATDPRGYRHEAVPYRGNAGFADEFAPFVREGIERGEAVLVAVGPDKIALLRDLLGTEGARAVRFVDMTELGRNPAHIIPAWTDFVASHPGPVRGIGEPIWAGRRPQELVECQLHEALLNIVVDPSTPFDLRCPYDELTLDDDVLDEAFRAHAPTDAMNHVMRLFTSGLPVPVVPVDEIPFAANDLRPVRDAVAGRASMLGYGRAHELVLAVHEIATNSVRYGGGSGVLRMWHDDDAFVVEIIDDGRLTDPLAGRLPPDLEHTGGRGLWLAHQLCDLVQVRSSERGTTVRISTWR